MPYTRQGQEWLFSDGSRLPVVSGGDGDEPPQGVVITDDPPAPARQQPPPPAAPQSFTAEDIERARKEEKDKLYNEQQTLKAKVKDYEKREQERKEAEDKIQREADENRRKQEEEELSAKDLLRQREAELRSEIDQIRQERERDRLIFERERELARIDTYRSQRVQQELQNESIIPRLAEFIRGNSEEEIEEAIQKAQEASQAIFEEAQAAFAAQGGQAQPPVRQAPPFTGAPPAGPAEQFQQGQKEFTIEELREMPLDDFRKHREALLRATSEQYYRQRGR